MAKWIKRVLGLAAVGSAAAGLFYYLKKTSSDDVDDDMDAFEDEDFDLDNDLKPVGDREYVPLNTPAKDEEEADSADSATEEAPREAAAEEEADAQDPAAGEADAQDPAAEEADAQD